MSQFLRLAFSAAAIATVAGSSATAFSQDEDAPRLKASKASSDQSGIAVTGHLGSGFAVFQDIQVPVNEDVEMRADGRQAGIENADHTGLPLAVGLGVEGGAREGAASGFGWTGNADFLQIRASSGPAGTQSATYVRLALGGGAAYHFGLGPLKAAVGSDAGLRRSVFSNVSNGHYIQSAMVGGTASIGSTSWILAGHGGFSPYARFGYYDGSMFGGHEFEKSTASVSELGVKASYLLKERLGKEVWLDLGLEREAISATIDDITEYTGFGLNVEAGTQASRRYNLSTTMATIALRKTF